MSAGNSGLRGMSPVGGWGIDYGVADGAEVFEVVADHILGVGGDVVVGKVGVWNVIGVGVGRVIIVGGNGSMEGWWCY